MKKKIAIITGNFFVLHSGHIRLFKFAKEYADFLYVGVNRNSISSKTNPPEDRLLSIQNCQLVDSCEIINSLKSYIKKIKPDIIVKGSEFRNKNNEEQFLKKKFNFELLFSKGVSGDIKNLLDKPKEKKKDFKLNLPFDYVRRHNIDNALIKKSYKNFHKTNVAVFGDIIIDEYIECENEGISREDVAIVVNKKNKKRYIGGASIVAAHLKSFGANVNFFSVGGIDQKYNFVKNTLTKQKINIFINQEVHRKTSLKQRYRVNGKSLLRVNEISNHPILINTENEILNNFSKIIKNINLVVFSDFNYGLLTNSLIKKVISLCKKNKIKIVADCQSSSQIGDITKYKYVDLLTPTEHELRIGLKNNNDNLTRLSNKIIDMNSIKHLIVKLGANGNLTSRLLNKNNLITDELPSLALDYVDLMGAGDALLASSSLALSTNLDIWHSSFVGSIASAIQINTEGNKPISLKQLEYYTDKILN